MQYKIVLATVQVKLVIIFPIPLVVVSLSMHFYSPPNALM